MNPPPSPAKKLTDFKYLNLFTTELPTPAGPIPWIFASRKAAPLSGPIEADAVVMVVIVSGPGEPRLVVLREFRATLGRHLLALPAGLVDPGENLAAAARRELREETGLDLRRIVHLSPPVASSAGLTDETGCLVYGEAAGTPSRAHLEQHEDIETLLLTLADIRRIVTQPSPNAICARLYPTLLGFLLAGRIALPPL